MVFIKVDDDMLVPPVFFLSIEGFLYEVNTKGQIKQRSIPERQLHHFLIY